MAHIKPSQPKVDEALQLKVAGSFYAKCTRVQQGIEWPAYPDKTRIAIQFEVNDDNHPKLRGMETAIITGESIYNDRKTGKKSRLFVFLQMMGFPDTDRKGFDPETLLDRWFFIQTELVEGRAYVRAAMPAPAPSKQGQTPTRVPSADEMPQVDGEAIPF